MQREAQTGGRGNSRLITSYRDFAAALTAEGILSDPWVDGAPRFRMTPVWLDRATQGALYDAASGVAALHAEAARLCALDPALRTRFFDLPPAYELMCRMSAPAWHGIARADVFLTADPVSSTTVISPVCRPPMRCARRASTTSCTSRPTTR